MKEALRHLLLYALCCTLPACITACGEIELPQPEAPGNTERPPHPEDSAAPDGPDNPDDPDNPENPENPENPDTPDTPDNPDTPDTPDNPDNPDTPDSPENPDTPDTPADEEPAVQVFGPVTLTADGHILFNDTFYISVEEFRNVTSAYSTTPDAAAEYAATYTEGDLSGWHIPTAEEAEMLHEALACTSPYYQEKGTEVLPLLNRALAERDWRGLYREWYLCDEGRQVFDFDISNSLKKAAKTTKYRLRLTRAK